jgi:hypothetical protein
MSPGEIRACYRLYAAHRRSHRPAPVRHFGHLRKMLASLAAQLFAVAALWSRVSNKSGLMPKATARMRT